MNIILAQSANQQSNWSVCLYSFVLEKKPWIFIFLCSFYRLTLFYQIRFDYVHLLKRLLHFSIPNKFTWRKIPQTKAVFLKKTQNWNNNYIYCTRLFSSKTKLMYKCINAMMNKYWVTFEAYPKISFQNVKMNLKRKPQVIN